jgi:hypothetical protein
MNQKLWAFVRDALFYAGVLLLVAALICWLANWRTLENFSTAFLVAGLMALILGTGRVMRFGIVRSGMYQYGQSVAPDRIMDSNRRETADIYNDTPFLLKMVVAALICFLISWLVGLAS